MYTIVNISVNLKSFIIHCIIYFLLFFQQTWTPSLYAKNDISNISSILISDLNDVAVWVDTFNSFHPIQVIPNQLLITNSNLKIGDNQYPYWLHFELQNPSQDTLQKWLHTSVFDSLTLFQITNKHLRLQEQRGLLIDYNAQQKQQFCSVWQDKYGFLLTIPPHSTSLYYLRIRNVVRAESNFSSFSINPIPLRVKTNGKRLMYFMLFSGTFFSVLFFLFLFSLVQYILNRNNSYGFYSLYLFFCFQYYWWKFEKSNSFINLIYTNFPEWYYYIEVPLWSAMYLTYMLFVMYFIDTKRYIPLFHQFLRISIIGLSSYVLVDRLVIWIWDLSVAWDLFAVMRLAMAIISIVMIYLVFRAKQRLGFYILWGSLLMLIGGFITIYLSNTMSIHYAGPWDIPLLPIQIGVIFEVFFFFVGLGDKSRLAEREKTIMHQNLKQQQKEAQEMKIRKEFLNRWYTNISHEFRTPLTVIEGMAEQIKGNVEQKNLILKNNHRLLSLVNQMLDLSKLESNKLSINWIQGDIIHFLNYFISSFQSFAQQKKIILSFHTQEKALIMDYDAEKLERILVNLLHNAIKFTPEYGNIKINIKTIKPETAAFLEIIIKDTGQGIAAKELPHIFDRFYQADHSSTQKNEGTGIGLALSKELTKLLGGDITVTSQLNKGTTFKLKFPTKVSH